MEYRNFQEQTTPVQDLVTVRERVRREAARIGRMQDCKHFPDEILEVRLPDGKLFMCMRCGEVSVSWDDFGSPAQPYQQMTRRRYDYDEWKVLRGRTKNIFMYEKELEDASKT